MSNTTVVIINWNGNKYLDKLLKALDKEDCEILTVDNCSTDGSDSMCDLLLNYNWGFSQGNNIAASQLQTENILFMNNDMLPKHGFLKEMERAALDYPIVGAKLIYGETKQMDVADMHLEMYEGKVQHAGIGINQFHLPYEMGRGLEPNDPQIDHGYEVSGVTGACMLVKTKLFCELGGFHTGFKNGFEDVDFCWRAREKGYKSWYESRAEVIHYCSSSVGRFDHEAENRALLISSWPPERVKGLQ
jgi:GT2 family glycosyltransferase